MVPKSSHIQRLNHWSASKECAKGISPPMFFSVRIPFQTISSLCPGISSLNAAKSHSSCRSHRTRRPFAKRQELGSKLKLRWDWKKKQASKQNWLSRYYHVSQKDWPSDRVSPNCPPNPQVLQDAVGTWGPDIWLHTTWRKRFLRPVAQWYLLEKPKRTVSKPGLHQSISVFFGKRF